VREVVIPYPVVYGARASLTELYFLGVGAPPIWSISCVVVCRKHRVVKREAKKATDKFMFWRRSTAKKCNSFVGETLVLMADGSRKPIREIVVGDQVIASDPETGVRGAREVTHVWIHPD